MSPDSHTPAQRADAVLRAAEAAAAAAAQAASLPDPAPPEPVAPPIAAVEPEPEPVPVPAEPEPVELEPAAAPEPPIHEAGAAGRLLAAAGDLEAHVAQARAQLDALEDALGRLERYDAPGD